MVEYGDFRGKPVITLKRDVADRFPLSFGLSKAKLIVSHLEEIMKFVKEQDPSFTPPYENILKKIIGKRDKAD